MSTELEYPVIVRRLSKDEGGGYVAEFPDLPGCFADGTTAEEAMAEGRAAIAAWIETAKEHGRRIPEPGTYDAYSGKFMVRLPKTLHGRIVARAQAEGVSLNAFVTAVLAEAIGQKSDAGSAHQPDGVFFIDQLANTRSTSDTSVKEQLVARLLHQKLAASFQSGTASWSKGSYVVAKGNSWYGGGNTVTISDFTDPFPVNQTLQKTFECVRSKGICVIDDASKDDTYVIVRAAIGKTLPR